MASGLRGTYGGGVSATPKPTTAAMDKRVFNILKECLDTPRILYMSEQPILLHRHDSRKKVLLVATKNYTYLIKQKTCKLYHRWLNRELAVEAQQASIVLRDSDYGDTVATRGSLSGEGAERREEFKVVTLEADSPLEAMAVEDQLSILIHNAQRAAALLEIEEAGGANSRLAAIVAGIDEDDDDAATDSSGSDDDDGSGGGVSTTGAGGDAGGKKPAVSGDGQQGLLKIAPSRYIAITSLVDGEFADYTTLKHAYLRHEEDDLLKDLATFIKENEGQVEALCEHHYPAFIHAAQQCLAISEKDAQLVGEELSGATALVRSAVVNMKQAAASLVVSRNTRDNLLQVRTLLSRAMVVVEYLETAEAQVEKQQLVGALASLRELVRLAAPLAEYALGEYVLQVRVPALTQDVFSLAIQHLNTWLKLLRDQARPIGLAAFGWGGRVAAGTFTKRVNMAPEDSAWWLSESFQAASLTLAPYEQGQALVAVCNGAAVQRVFCDLRREDYLVKHYTEGRAQQARADLFEVPLVTQGVAGSEVVDEFAMLCATALGFMLIEDAVYHATSPHLQSRAEVLNVWDKLAGAVAARARATSQALLSADPTYAELIVRMTLTLRRLAQHAAENVRSVELSPLALSRVIEALSDNVVSWALQSACVECTQLVFSAPPDALTVSSAEEFATYVSRFYLHMCPQLELPVPPAYTSGTVTLPYSTIVPAIGDQVLRFLDQCATVVATDASSAVRQSELNNVEEMLLKYVLVLFRTVAESLSGQLMAIPPRSVLQLATFVTSCSAMPVIVSCAEQRCMLNWLGSSDGGGGGERQLLGRPRLLSSASAFFAKTAQKGIEALLAAYVGEMEDRLRVTASFSYWKRQIDVRNGRQQQRRTGSDGGAEEGMADCMNYAIGLVPPLLAILQRTVACSVVGTAIANAGMTMQNNIQKAIGDAYANGERDFAVLRDAVREWQLQCTLLVPQWQCRLGEVMRDLSAVQRFPLHVSNVVDDVTSWLDQKDALYSAEKANQPPILAGLEVTGKAVAKGFRAMGDAAAATASVFKKE